MCKQVHPLPMTVATLMICSVLLGCCPEIIPTATEPPPVPTSENAPQVHGVAVVTDGVKKYERFEAIVDLTATYTNPYDQAEVTLEATFVAPSGEMMTVPGFWDGKESWRVRFGPWEEGEWHYAVHLQDTVGQVEAEGGSFDVAPSEHHGWLQVASWVDPAYSSRYLVHHDGTPFYGVGHCDAWTIFRYDPNYGLDPDVGIVLFDLMREHGENIVVYWPHEINLFFQAYDDYSWGDMAAIDAVFEEAEQKDVYIMYTIWDHALLRDETHPWGGSKWYLNGFREATPNIEGFFTDEYAWHWQENLYRYLIARWGYSQAMAWQTVSEIDGTNAYGHTDEWHARVNQYFVDNDPYRHPATASMAGDRWWPAGNADMDLPQMHSYDSRFDIDGNTDRVIEWTKRMWKDQAKPNFIGEFGAEGQASYPDMLHDAIWGALTSGAAITPMKWHDTDRWSKMTDVNFDQMAIFSAFVIDIPFHTLNLEPAKVEAGESQLKVEGLVGDRFALVWVMDPERGHRQGDTVTIYGLTEGEYVVRPFDTWQGTYLPANKISVQGNSVTVVLPDYKRDIALKVEGK